MQIELAADGFIGTYVVYKHKTNVAVSDTNRNYEFDFVLMTKRKFKF